MTYKAFSEEEMIKHLETKLNYMVAIFKVMHYVQHELELGDEIEEDSIIGLVDAATKPFLGTSSAYLWLKEMIDATDYCFCVLITLWTGLRILFRSLFLAVFSYSFDSD